MLEALNFNISSFLKQTLISSFIALVGNTKLNYQDAIFLMLGIWRDMGMLEAHNFYISYFLSKNWFEVLQH